MKPWLNSWLESRASFSVGRLSPPLQCAIILRMRHEIGLPDGGSPQISCYVSPLKTLGAPSAHFQWLGMTNRQQTFLSTQLVECQTELPLTIRRFNTKFSWASSLSRLASLTFLLILKLEARLLTKDCCPENMS